MKRLCIYLAYDKQGIVDRYIGYMLKELKTCSDTLVVVYNEKNIVRGGEILEAYADKLFFRENLGFDAGGFKDALCNFLGWDKALGFDELVLANDSMFGPFKPMKEIFGDMEKKTVDFWGLTKHGETNNPTIGHISEHIQSYFFVIRSKLLHSPDFAAYWENMPYYETLHDTVMRYEMEFTRHFAKLGYAYDTLADMRANDSAKIENNYLQYATIPYELIKKRNFPFLKKKMLTVDTLNCQTQQNLRQAIEYIGKETDYNVNFIWENIVRTMNMTDLQRTLHLQYIISDEKHKTGRKNILIAIFVRYPSSAEYVLEYMEELRKEYAVKVIAENVESLNAYRDEGFDCKMIDGGKGRRAFYEEASGYDFVCVLHDADMTSETKPSCNSKSYFYYIWENLIKCKNHVGGILNVFETEPHLGFLSPPPPNFAEYFGDYGKMWDGKFEKVAQVIKEMDLNCQISIEKAPFCITENFWVRGRVLKKLKAVDSRFYPYLNYMWIYFAQDMGYYSGVIESAEYASINEVNLQHYLSQIAHIARLKYGNFNCFEEMEINLTRYALQDYCSKYTRIFVYGTGYISWQYRNFIQNIEAFLVSDGQRKQDDLDGIPVKYLSEVDISDEIGVVLCLNEENQAQVIPLLEKRGVKQYFCI